VTETLTREIVPVVEDKTPRRFTITATEGETPTPDSERVRSEYVETEWLPYLGPVALLLARRIDLALTTHSKDALGVDKVAAELGVQPDDIIAACHRLVRYGLATWNKREPMLLLNRHWPKVPLAIATPAHRAALMALPDVPMMTP
jgi:hypothetical protein